MLHIAFDYEVSKTAIWKSISWAEDILVKNKIFSLPPKRKILADSSLKEIIIDTTEFEIERPKKQKAYYSGKKKKHTLKMQVIADASTSDVIRIFVVKGSQHDFRLFKESDVYFQKQIWVFWDKGFQSLDKLHMRSLTPIKSGNLLQ